MAIQVRRGNKANFEPDRLQPGEIATPLDTDEVYARTGSGALPLVTKGGKNDIFNLIYPVGSIYLTDSNVNPGTLFGGTWDRIAQGRALVGVNPDDPDFSDAWHTGGEKTHTLTIAEMPKHSHDLVINSLDGSATGLSEAGGTSGTALSWVNSTYVKMYADNRGGDQPHNNMPPYFTCFIWRRRA